MQVKTEKTGKVVKTGKRPVFTMRIFPLFYPEQETYQYNIARLLTFEVVPDFGQ